MNKITQCRLCGVGCLIETSIDKNNNISAEIIEPLHLKRKPICPKLQAVNEIIYSPNRLTDPLQKVKKKKKWEKQSWENILEIISSKLKYYKKYFGAESICWLRGQAADWGTTWHYVLRFMNVFGSPNVIGNGSVCHGAREFAHRTTYGEMTFPDCKNSKCIIIWGGNNYDTYIQQFENILFAKEHGAKLIVIDPVKTKLTEFADFWLQIKPGGDGLLAMAMINVIIKENLYDKNFVDKWTIGFDKLLRNIDDYSPEAVSKITNINPSTIRKIARLYANTKPACIGEGNGIDMHIDVFETTRAICVLRSLTGNLDKKGGDSIPQPIPFRNINLAERKSNNIKSIAHDYSLFNSFKPIKGIPALGALTDAIINQNPYPIKVLIIQGSNPVVTMANTSLFLQALKSLDLIIVIDLFMTQTAKLADIVLPTTTSFETTRINEASLFTNRVILQEKVVDCFKNSWPDWKITFQLAKKMGYLKEFPWENVEQAINYQLEPININVKQLRLNPKGIIFEEKRNMKYLTDNFNTPSGKVEIFSEKMKKNGFNALPLFKKSINNYSFYNKKDKYPILAINGSRPRYFVHSQFRNIKNLLENEPEPFVDIHPIDAKKEIFLTVKKLILSHQMEALE